MYIRWCIPRVYRVYIRWCIPRVGRVYHGGYILGWVYLRVLIVRLCATRRAPEPAFIPVSLLVDA